MTKNKKPEPEDFSLTHAELERIQREIMHARVANSPLNFLSYPWYPLIPIPLLGKDDGIPLAIFLGLIWLVYIFLFQDDLNHSHREKTESQIAGLEGYNKYNSAAYKYKLTQEKLIKAQQEKEREERRTNYDYWSNLDPYEFEKEIAILFEKHGFNTKVTKGSGDGGVDIWVKRNKNRYAVQCKRYSKKVGPAAVRDLYGTMISGQFDGGFLVCPSGFSEKAFEFSKHKNIQFIGLKRIMEMVLSERDVELKFLSNISKVNVD